MLRLVCISDTHSLHRQITVPEGDVLLHAGDFTRRGELDELRDFNDWLGTLPHPNKIVIAGNHDRICEEVPELIPQLLSNATYLCDTSTVIAGYSFYGAPWIAGIGGWAFTRSLNTLVYRWANIPTNTDVLITHGPPLGGQDRNYKGEYLGCPVLAEAVLRVRPKLHLFGHVHEAYGVAEAQGITFANVSTCTPNYAATNAPLVFELP